MLQNVTFECDKTACSYIRNNKEYYRDNNKDEVTDCAAWADNAETPLVMSCLLHCLSRMVLLRPDQSPVELPFAAQRQDVW